MRVILTYSECRHIAICFNERALGNALVTIDTSELRLMFARAALEGAEPKMFELNSDQLRALDTLLTDSDPRSVKLPDGTPVMGLVEKIWRARLGGDGNARDEDYYVNADPDENDRAPVLRP